jgi:hypothetical protein
MKEKNRLEAEWRNVWEQNRIKDSQMTLNIGGIRFTTSLTTLILIKLRSKEIILFGRQ